RAGFGHRLSGGYRGRHRPDVADHGAVEARRRRVMTTRPLIRVSDVMRREPSIVDGMATAEEALALMSSRNISSLVVQRRDADDEFGLVLIADIAREIIGRGRPLARTNVYEIMTKPAPMVDAEMNIKY